MMCEFGVVNSGGDVLKEERVFLSGGRAFSRPDPASFTEESLSAAEKAAQEVLNFIHPTLDSEERRRDVIDHLQILIKSHFNCEVFPYGSVPLKTYLLDGDIDLTVLKGPNAEESLAKDVYAVLLGEEQNENAEFQINHTLFIDAEVKLVKCLVQNIVVDISFNQLGGLSTLCFLEQVDRLVGRNHLFKRSIILIKAWCFYESRILGAPHGLISTYALETLILYIFQLFHASLSGPLVALYRFLDYFSQFDWDNYCISLKGPVCRSSLPEIVAEMPNNGSNDLLLGDKFMENCMEMLSVSYGWLETNKKEFRPKHLNIIDPLKENNNLGRSVHRGNFFRVLSAFKYGARKLGQILLIRGDQVADEINNFFANTLSRHKKQSGSGIEHLALEFGDDTSSTESLSSHVDLFSEDDLLQRSSFSDFDDDSAGMEEKSIALFENESGRCLVREVYSDKASETSYSADGVVISGHYIAGDVDVFGSTNSCMKNGTPNYLSNRKYSPLSGNLCVKSNYLSAISPAKNENIEYGNVHNSALQKLGRKNTRNWCMDNSEVFSVTSSDFSTPKGSVLENLDSEFREMDLSSIGEESEVIDPLADLSGDYDSHIRSFLFGQLSHGFASSAFGLSSPPSPSRIQNKKPCDNVHQSIPLSANHSFPMNSCALSVGQTIYSAAGSSASVTAFRSEGKPNARGTGTYFPPMVNGFYRDRPLQGRGRSKAPGTHSQFHRYGRSNGFYPAFSRSNSFENSTREVVPVQNKSQGQWKSDVRCQTALSAGDGNQTNSFLSSSCRIEFGSVGNLAEELLSGSSHVRGSNLCGGFNSDNKAKEVRKTVNTP